MPSRPTAEQATAATRWTAATIANLPPRSSPYTDPGQPGLQLFVRARKDRAPSRTWLLRCEFRGEEFRMTIGTVGSATLDEARGEVRRYRELAAGGVDPRRARPKRRATERSPSPTGAPPSGHSIEFLASEFVERFLRPNRKRPEYAEKILKKDVLPEWRGRDARTIDAGEVVDVLDKIIERGSKVMANRTADVIGQMFKFGIQRRIVTSTPVQLLYRPGGTEKPRQRTLTDAELRTLLKDPQAATRYERLSRVILILLLTGQRRGELALARWSDVDLKAKTWNIPDENAKGGRGHVVPLSAWAVEEFHALKREAEKSPFVLPGVDPSKPLEAKLLTRGLAKCQDRMQKLKIGSFTLHDLRRTCRTGLARLKIAPHIAERVLNHAQERIAGTYDRFEYLDEKRVALDKWAKHLKKLRP